MNRHASVLACSLAMSCGTFLGLDDYAEIGGVGGQGGRGDGGSEVMLTACDGAGVPAGCTEAVPLGFSGPVVITERDGACGGPYAQLVAQGALAFDAPPAECACSCEAMGGSCDRVIATTFDNAGCVGPIAGTNPSPSTRCVGTSGAANSFKSGSAVAETTPAKCMPHESATKPPIATEMHDVCGVATAVAQSNCGDGNICVPLPDASQRARVCVFTQEDAPDCPNAYPVPFELAVDADFADTRACETCECPMSAEPSCVGSMRFAFGAGCASTYADLVVGGPCVTPSATATYSQIEVTLMQDGPTVCEPIGNSGVATGDVVAAQPLTLCCTPLIGN